MPFRKNIIKKSLSYTQLQMNIAKCWTTGRTDNGMSNWVNVKLGLMSNLG